MKKILFLVLASLYISASAFGQQKSHFREGHLKFGITAGANFTQIENYGGGVYAYFDYIPSWQVGFTMQYKWGDFLTYSIQPELRYIVSHTEIDPVIGQPFGDMNLGALELPVNFQFGPQLSSIFRPFVQTGINLSYLVNKKGEFAEYVFDQWSMYNRFNLGISTGVGFDLWRFQFQCNYRWGLTNTIKDKQVFDRVKTEGFEFTFGFFF